MTVPNVLYRVLNGRLGVRAPGGVELHAYVGPCSDGTVNTPTRHVRSEDLLDTYESGPAAELAVSAIERWKGDVLMVRSTASTVGSYGTIDTTGVTGGATVTVDAATHPDDDYEVYVEIVAAGAVGTDGITYMWSLDGGRTMSPVTALGTAASIVIPNSGGIAFSLSPATIDLTALNTLINEIYTDQNAHVILTTGTVHGAADSADVVSIASATNTATRIARINALRLAYIAHIAKGSLTHLAADATNVLVVGPATNDTTALLLALDLKAKLNAHDGNLAAHTIADATNVVTSPAPAAGTFAAGDSWSILAIAPCWSTTDLSNALAPLKTTLHQWKAVWIAGPVDAAAAAVISTFLTSMESVTGQSRKAYVSLRMPDPGESEATYLDDVSTDFASFADRRITCCYAAARVLSARTGRPFDFRRPVIHAIAGLPAALPLSVDMAQTVDATPDGLPGVTLYDENGNQVEHDEMQTPGADDARFLALRTWPGLAGVFVNNPSTLEQVGGDFHLDQFVRILCEFCNTARRALVAELSRDLDLNQKTNGVNIAGAPNERECQRIDARVLEAVRIVLKTHTSALQFALHRDDLVLTTQTLNGDGGIGFKGYPKLIVFSVAAINPAAAA